jgi:hypothetical protein
LKAAQKKEKWGCYFEKKGTEIKVVEIWWERQRKKR